MCVSINNKLRISAGAYPDLIKTDHDANEFNEYLENVLRSLESESNEQKHNEWSTD